MTSTCWYCKRDVRAERNSRGVLTWRDMERGKTTCDKRGELSLHSICPTVPQKGEGNSNES